MTTDLHFRELCLSSQTQIYGAFVNAHRSNLIEYFVKHDRLKCTGFLIMHTDTNLRNVLSKPTDPI